MSTIALINIVSWVVTRTRGETAGVDQRPLVFGGGRSQRPCSYSSAHSQLMVLCHQVGSKRNLE
ncbi:hypothetical protein M413DRAFT_274266 [Hebeloma cylindrosporum]|uniref:Uncharacterized protein n=1 Tax=Hebeloma cylindrosporum TaxID=76867 RepID=A0A0C3BL28_HEBCY|nr:hypothetical protein M413DRAFT_274266 [Hebeloma cylindrosporum h7]